MKKYILIIGIVLIISGCNMANTNQHFESDSSNMEKIVEGDSMEPLIENGSVVLFSSGYYDDVKSEVKLGDIVLYDFKGEKHPIIKSIVARDSDSVELKNNTLFVNKKEVKNSAGESYNFSSSEQKMMKLYINKENKIPNNSVFILGDNVKISRDSRKFGAVSMNDILGKVNLKK